MSEKHVYKLCPCNPCDIEGIQTWLEDLAAQGLFPVKDGSFCGFFSFERNTPRKVIYRLDVAQKQKSRLLDSGDQLTGEELELYRAMGWEYLLQYGDFRIYRATATDAPELHTESQTHAVTVRLLKKKYRSSFFSAVLLALFWLVFSNSALSYGFRIAASVGLGFLLCVHGALLDGWITQLLRMLRLRRYEKRLRSGDSLNRKADWKKSAPMNYLSRALPFLLAFGIAFGLFSNLARVGTEIPCAQYPGDPPFATVADVFPGGTVSNNNVWMDYGTYQTGKTALATSWEWNESCDVTTVEGEQFFCILRLQYHETASEWIARGLEQDYYRYDANRYRGKRFEDLDAPALGVDSIRVYSSYGTLNILMRQDSRVVHAVVTLDNKTYQNQWRLWAEAMAESLLRG